MKSCVLSKIFQCILCLLCFVFPIFAQGNESDNIGLDVSFQFGSAKGTKNALGRNLWGIGGRAGYYLGSGVFLDGEILHQPNGWRERSSRDVPTDETVFLGGIRFGTVFDDVYGVFAKARAGAFRFHSDFSNLQSAKDVYPIIDIGIVVERYYERIFLRVDVGDWIIPFGDTMTPYSYDGSFVPEGSSFNTRIGTKHNFVMELGFGFRF